MSENNGDIPALEIESELSMCISPDLRTQTTRPGRHGPAISKKNGIACLIHDPQLRRIYIGMQLGEVLFWDMKPRTGATGHHNKLYSAHSSHKMIGKHAVCLQNIFLAIKWSHARLERAHSDCNGTGSSCLPGVLASKCQLTHAITSYRKRRSMHKNLESQSRRCHIPIGSRPDTLPPFWHGHCHRHVF